MKKNAWIAGFTAVVTAGLVFMAPVSVRADEVVPAGVFVGNMNLEGMTEEEAEEAVKEARLLVNAESQDLTYLDVDITFEKGSGKGKAVR